MDDTPLMNTENEERYLNPPSTPLPFQGERRNTLKYLKIQKQVKGQTNQMHPGKGVLW